MILSHPAGCQLRTSILPVTAAEMRAVRRSFKMSTWFSATSLIRENTLSLACNS